MTEHGIIGFIALNWWWLIWVVPGIISAVSESTRDFFIGLLTARSRELHRQKMKELKLQQKIAASTAAEKRSQLENAGADDPITPGICPHPIKKVVPVIAEGDDTPSAWLCTVCDTQLPAKWAVRKQDIQP